MIISLEYMIISLNRSDTKSEEPIIRAEPGHCPNWAASVNCGKLNGIPTFLFETINRVSQLLLKNMNISFLLKKDDIFILICGSKFMPNYNIFF